MSKPIFVSSRLIEEVIGQLRKSNEIHININKTALLNNEIYIRILETLDRIADEINALEGRMRGAK